MFLEFLEGLRRQVRATVSERFGVTLEAVAFQYPPRAELGDLALTAPFDLARSLRRKPRELAQELVEALASLPGVVRSEVAGGGYVNLFLDRGAFARELFGWLRQPAPAPARPGQVIVEHTSINPNKAAHIGHLRNAVLGDTLVRALRHRGNDVSVQNYIDDTGVQVADVVVGFAHLERMSLADVRKLTAGPRFDYLCWDLYARVGDFYAEDPTRRKLQADTLHAIEAGGNDTAELAGVVARAIVDCHLGTMRRLGIRYDLLAHESDILRQHFWNRAFEKLKEAGAVRLETEGKNSGCWVLGMESSGGLDEDKILVRSNGTVTYTGKDIAYQLWKLGRLGLDFRYRRHAEDPDGHVLWSTTSADGDPGAPGFGHARAAYNVIDTGQSYPQRVVKAGVAAAAGEQAAEGSHHVGYEKVVLSGATARELGFAVEEGAGVVKVSGRKGLGVKADDLVDALVAKARSEVDARDPERDPDARDQTARDIAIGALRYFLLRFSRNKVITFDMQEALAFTGETGPYLQNSAVRARNILVKLEAQGHAVPALLEAAATLDLAPRLTRDEGEEIWSLLMLMARSDEIAEQAIASQEATLLAKHAFAVAQTFHGWYQNPAHTVLHAGTPEERAFRAAVVDAFVRQMLILASLLGIPIPGRM